MPPEPVSSTRWWDCGWRPSRRTNEEVAMRVSVEQDKCASSGNCVMHAPEIFDQRDDDGVVVVLDETPPADQEHTRFRRMLSKPFTYKRVEALRPAIQQITDDCIDTMLAGAKPGEIVSALALPVPSLVISQLLGVPYEDAEMFQHHANVGLARYAAAEDTMKGAMSLHKYLAQLVESKMASPAQDAVSDLAERVKAGELSVKEAAQLGTGLLIAGHETTANMIGLGVLAL